MAQFFLSTSVQTGGRIPAALSPVPSCDHSDKSRRTLCAFYMFVGSFLGFRFTNLINHKALDLSENTQEVTEYELYESSQVITWM